MTTAYFWDQASLLHDTGNHVENRRRAEVLNPELMSSSLRGNVVYPATVEHDTLAAIQRVHPFEYVNWVKSICQRGGGLLDQGDTHVCPDSFNAATRAVETALSAADFVMTGQARNAFCAIRPPGHHALIDRAMGFCIFGNIAIVARHLQSKYGIGRVAIVDFDVHHGNGTQDIFYEDSSVFVVSMQQYPLWPMSGLAEETGSGDGEGFTLNIPIAPGTSEEDQLAEFEATVLPALRDFKPEFLLISAGFDAHRDDPLADLNLTESGYEKMTRWLMDIADECCDGRIVSLLEGGYKLDDLIKSVAAHVNTLTCEE